MKLTIDTTTDSAQDINAAISMLQTVLASRGQGATPVSASPVQTNTYTSSADDRLARKLARAKAKGEARSQPAATPMGMFGAPAPETKPAPESEPAFNMFDSSNEPKVETVPMGNMFDTPAPATTSSSANDLLNENTYSSESEESDDEPKVEIIPF